MAPPTIAATLKIKAPAFIRKVGRASHWEQESADANEAKARSAVQQVFRNQTESAISIYLVRSDDDLRRVAIGMNANRDSLTEAIAFLVFSQAEMTMAGIGEPAQTPGDLKCDYANALHFDMTATDAQLEDLCVRLMKVGREAARCSRGAMKDAERLTVAEQCKSAPNVSKCGVAVCVAGQFQGKP